ncbi:MAG: homoserine O-succinyltransferase [Pseudomonadota bacterium]
MALIAHTELPSFERLAGEGYDVLSGARASTQDIRELHIGVLNMMPDAALEATERQFLRLLASCNRIVQLYVHLFTMPGIPRAGDALEHVARFYEPYPSLAEQGLDALLITGANPVEPDIRDEPYWESLRQIMDWANENVTSTLCSCLASHAAFKQYYGVERIPLPTKQWGVYSHRVVAPDHPLVGNINSRFDAPHSRWNNVPVAELEAAGIRVLATSETAGVHLACSEDGIRWVYFQGHPEYDANSLAKEYKREVMRFSSGVIDDYPPFPDGYFNAGAKALLDAHRDEALAARQRGETGPSLDEDRLNAQLENSWTDTGKAIFNNWLGLVYRLTHRDRLRQFMDGVDPADPLGGIGRIG